MESTMPKRYFLKILVIRTRAKFLWQSMHIKGLLDYAILWEISLLRKKNGLESCKQEQ